MYNKTQRRQVQNFCIWLLKLISSSYKTTKHTRYAQVTWGSQTDLPHDDLLIRIV